MSSEKRHPYMRGYAFWSQNRFWDSMKTLSPSGRLYYDVWLNNMRFTDKYIEKNKNIGE